MLDANRAQRGESKADVFLTRTGRRIDAFDRDAMPGREPTLPRA
jgi:hypothetical protein